VDADAEKLAAPRTPALFFHAAISACNGINNLVALVGDKAAAALSQTGVVRQLDLIAGLQRFGRLSIT